MLVQDIMNGFKHASSQTKDDMAVNEQLAACHPDDPDDPPAGDPDDTDTILSSI